MDWSGIYLATQFNVPAAHTGLAYSFFAGLMVLGRFSGHLIIKVWVKNHYFIKCFTGCSRLIHGDLCTSMASRFNWLCDLGSR